MPHRVRALEEVVHAVGDLDVLTHENAELVQRASYNSDRLMMQVLTLEISVGDIQLRQGTADQARQMVFDAMVHIRTQGLIRPRQIFMIDRVNSIDRDLYVFVFDCYGRYLVHGALPERMALRSAKLRAVHADGVRCLGHL